MRLTCISAGRRVVGNRDNSGAKFTIRASPVLNHQFIALNEWIQAAKTSGLTDLRNFAMGLRRDYEAVSNALKLPWSNGPTEDQVHRLKMIKRQMYGRAKFDLLRKRVLQAG